MISTPHLAISVISFLLIVGVGLMPQTYAGTVPPPDIITSELDVQISCGIVTTGSADFGFVSVGETVFNNDVTLLNPGTGTAQIAANVGTSLISSPQAGGYAGTTDKTTHIAPREITLQIDTQGRVPMSDFGFDAAVGELGSTDSDVLEVGVSLNPINLPTSDSLWRATFFLTVSGCSIK